MIVKWRTTTGVIHHIARVECSAETTHDIWFSPTYGLPKRGPELQFHDTWAQARDYLMAEAGQALYDAERQLRRAAQDVADIARLKPPVDAAFTGSGTVGYPVL